VVICLEQSVNYLQMVQLIPTLSSFASLQPRMVYLSGAGFPSCPGKEAIKRVLL